MNKSVKKYIKTATANKAKLPKKTANLRELVSVSDKGAVLVKLTKSGEALPRKNKKAATHIVLETENGGAIAEPLTRAPKPPKELRVVNPIGAQPEEKPTREDGKWHPPIPPECTYAAYQWTNGNLFMTPVQCIDDLKDFRGGRLLMGKLRYGEDLRILWPESEAGNVIEWKSGRTVFAEGKSPEEMKRKERAAVAALERLNDPKTKETLAAGRAAGVAKRKAAPGPRPGDIPGKIQNGVRKPGEGGKTARVWAVCDELFAKLGRCPTKPEVFAVAVEKEKANPGMVGTNYSYWRRFYGRS